MAGTAHASSVWSAVQTADLSSLKMTAIVHRHFEVIFQLCMVSSAVVVKGIPSLSVI